MVTDATKLDANRLFCDLIGKLSVCETRTTQTVLLSHYIDQYTNEPHKHTHRSAHLTTPGVGVSTHDITCATTPYASFPPFSLSSFLTQSLLSCCWSQSRVAWGGSVGCGCGLCCRGAGLAPKWYTEASCARRSSSGPPSQFHPSPLAPAPLHAQLRLCWNCMPMGGPL